MSKKQIILISLTILIVVFSTYFFNKSEASNPIKKIASCRFGGKNRGLCNNNPGNIKKSSYNFKGRVSSTDATFEQFDSMENGVLAIATLLSKNYIQKGYDTPKTIINRYAPSSENNTVKYINNLVKKLNEYDKYVTFQVVDENTKIVFDTELFYLLIKAIVFLETSYTVTDSQLEYASSSSNKIYL